MEKRIHQIWFDIGAGGDAPHKDRSHLLQEIHPDFEYHMWSLEEAESLMRSEMPSVLELWYRLPHGINKADTFRYVLMFLRGGVYVDLDFVCVHNLTPFVECATPVVGEEWPCSLGDATVHNGILFSGARHQHFWLSVLQEVQHRCLELSDSDERDVQKSVFKLTGTAMLRDVVVATWQRNERRAEQKQDEKQDEKRDEKRVIVAPFYVFCPLASRVSTRLVLSYTDPLCDLKNSAEWRLVAASDRFRLLSVTHVFTFVGPATATWQSLFGSQSFGCGRG